MGGGISYVGQFPSRFTAGQRAERVYDWITGINNYVVRGAASVLFGLNKETVKVLSDNDASEEDGELVLLLSVQLRLYHEY